MEEEFEDKLLEPGPEISPALFRRWQMARRGSVAAEEMTNPVWLWLFRGRVDPYHANEQFRGWFAKWLSPAGLPGAPRWAGCRLGQSCTALADGRKVWIAGEHEDFYDPDFYIYNDVIIEQADGSVQIFGYPEEVFRPTDFHSATAIDHDTKILIVGSLGYTADRREGVTQVYLLDLQDLSVTEVETTGDPPGWIHRHEAKLSSDGLEIVVRGGEVMRGKELVENVDDWSFRIADQHWTRLTDRQWPQFQVTRVDEEALHVWQFDTLSFWMCYGEKGRARVSELERELGAPPNVDAYERLYCPGVPHESVGGDEDESAEIDEDGETDWRTKRIVVDGVPVRFVDDTMRLMITVEGILPPATLKAIVDHVVRELSLVENAPCCAKTIGSAKTIG